MKFANLLRRPILKSICEQLLLSLSRLFIFNYEHANACSEVILIHVSESMKKIDVDFVLNFFVFHFFKTFFIAPVIKSSPENFTITIGIPKTIRCRAQGNPLPTIIWEKNDIRIDQANQHFRIVTQEAR